MVSSFSGYWLERLGDAINRAVRAAADDERKGRRECNKVKKVNGKTDLS